jgi:hypothetical protein
VAIDHQIEAAFVGKLSRIWIARSMVGANRLAGSSFIAGMPETVS